MPSLLGLATWKHWKGARSLLTAEHLPRAIGDPARQPAAAPHGPCRSAALPVLRGDPQLPSHSALVSQNQLPRWEDKPAFGGACSGTALPHFLFRALPALVRSRRTHKASLKYYVQREHGFGKEKEGGSFRVL